MNQEESTELFDEKTWADVDAALTNLPSPVHLQMFGFEDASDAEKQTAVLGRALAERYENIDFVMRSRRKNYPYYPVLAVMGDADGKPLDYRVRIIGWPEGHQLTTLIVAIQAVAFKGQGVEPLVRIQLAKLAKPVVFELMTDAQDSLAGLPAKQIFGMAVVHEQIEAYIIMADQFPDAAVRHSVDRVPHLTINGRVHIEGAISDEALLRHMALAVK